MPTDRDQEGKYRVAPKGYSSGGRVVRSGSGAGRGSGEWTPMNDGGLNDSTGSSSSRAAQRRRADLASNRASVSSSATATPSLGKASLSPLSSPKTPLGDKRRSFGSAPLKRRPMLIRNLNKVATPKVVGEMRWNPQTLRWEGNDHVLRDFDNAMSSSTRPALITQLSGAALGSPVSSASGIPGARVVGNMLFDPVKMCWVSQLPPEEEEPDVFADMADDEDDDGSEWEKSKGGTIRGLAGIRFAPPSPRPSAPPGKVLIERASPARGGSLVAVGSRAADGNPSPSHSTHSHSQSELESGSERGYGSLEQERLSKEGDDVEGGIVSQRLFEETGLAEKRHQVEMTGWFVDPSSLDAPNSFTFPAYGQDVAHSEMDRAYLYELRAIASANSPQS